jgi:Reverse transcriptase (RNA-dependent DNA polymerase)
VQHTAHREQQASQPEDDYISTSGPLVKKLSLDPDNTKSCSSTSNLSFILKVVERIVSQQVRESLTKSDHMPLLPSAYPPCNATEMAVLKVISDIIHAADNQKLTSLSLLDTRAAFDTVDHRILLKRLDVTYGIGGDVLAWFSSFLSERWQVVAFARGHLGFVAVPVTTVRHHSWQWHGVIELTSTPTPTIFRPTSPAMH